METVKYLILGAGPSGLAFAHTLRNQGETSFLVLEKEAVAGGLCRSVEVDGAPLDIGGGHFLDLKRQDVLDLLFQFMPATEWREHIRVSKINICGTSVDHPLEANLWQLDLEDQVDFLESIAQAGCVRGEPMPGTFEDWITWKLGEKIAAEYMLPYNRKIWSMPLGELGLYWLYKLPDVSFRETLQSCLEGKAFGSLPAHGRFLYPEKYGYGEVWQRMGEALGDQFLPNTPVSSIDVDTLTVNGQYIAETIVTSIPWPIWQSAATLPSGISAAISQLRQIPIDVDYHAETLQTDAHWIYEPRETLSYHRILCRSNFAPGSRGYWTETNSSRSPSPTHYRHTNEYAYPLNTIGKPAAVETIRSWGLQHSIICLGRWGTWEHMNSDVATSQAILAARNEINKKQP